MDSEDIFFETLRILIAKIYAERFNRHLDGIRKSKDPFRQYLPALLAFQFVYHAKEKYFYSFFF